MKMYTDLQERFLSLAPETRRLLLYLTAAVLVLLTAYSSLHSHLSALAKKKQAREQTLKELLILQQRHREAAVDAQRLTNRVAAVTPGDTPALIVEQLGMVPRGGIQSKPLPRQEQGALVEEGAELTLSGLSLNETVNLLYRIEQGAKPLAIRKGLLRSRFNDPSRLDLTLQLALFRAATSPQATQP